MTASTVFGKGCDSPDQKCDRGRYKQRLIEAIYATGTIPRLGGIEYVALADEVDRPTPSHRTLLLRQQEDGLAATASDLNGGFRSLDADISVPDLIEQRRYLRLLLKAALADITFAKVDGQRD